MIKTEFGGDSPSQSTVQPKGKDALTASEKLRLIYLTGQESDSSKPVDRRAWRGELP